MNNWKNVSATRAGARLPYLRWPRSPILRTIVATAPWLVLVALIAAKGLWWTQRPAMLRLFVLCAIASWSAAWCRAGAKSTSDASAGGPARAATLLAAVFGVLGLQGAAFGVTSFGCAISAVLAAIATIVFGVACLGSRSAHLKMFAASLASLMGVLMVDGAVRRLRIGQNVQEVDNREYAREFYSLTPPGAVFVNDPKPLDEFGPALIEINSLGIRGPELTDRRTDLLLIGDSMIEARQLPWPETLGPRLQEALRARGLPLRVVAHGMRGWSPLLEWNWYLKVGRRLQPKTVMLFFFWNDLWTAGNEVSTFRAELDANGRPVRFNLPVDSPWIWYKHVRVLRVAEDVSRRLSVTEVRRAFTTVAASKGSGAALDATGADQLARTLTRPPLNGRQIQQMLTKPEQELSPDLRELFGPGSFWPGFRPMSLWDDAQRAAAAHIELELQRFAEDVKADGGRFVIVYVPNPLQVGGNECAVGRLFARVDTGVVLPPVSGIQSWLRGISERHGIDLLDPSAEMRTFNGARPAAETSPLYLRADCHWSARGHGFMAEYLAEWVRRSAIVSEDERSSANSPR